MRGWARAVDAGGWPRTLGMFVTEVIGMTIVEWGRGRIYDDITQTIGNTPLVRLRRVPDLGERYLSTPLFPE